MDEYGTLINGLPIPEPLIIQQGVAIVEYLVSGDVQITRGSPSLVLQWQLLREEHIGSLPHQSYTCV